ncbi:heme biosynthesis HemY N-terminal domain-containing protein [Spiribacter vilamensis]|uniref:HemY protein n=1 Tax=Spiribacter vilamensis TaxID=531306 RepID=A0A4Q8D290_9GAMM|nr:heme biosynthesis HemY N-terminal domain-containing protein [Spiribacter vilamensis]RZU99489.1 HemY protein [Spiribacter vilamensis]TVO61539.1 heme biosynthesis protein HemY [Spiribacter vilamensis]
MIRRLIGFIVLLLASVLAAQWFANEGGFLMVRVGEWTIQTSLFVAVLAFIALWALVTLAFGLLRRTAQAPGQVRDRLAGRRTRKAQRELIDGLIELAEGRYAQAERHLEGTSRISDQPLMHHLLAAIAAQRRGEWQRRDDLLAEADAANPRARLAVGLLQAQLQVDAEQWEQALATLGWLREKAPRNHRVLMLQARAMQAVDDYAGLLDLLPDLRREQSLPSAELTAIEQRALDERIGELGTSANADSLGRIWKSLPKARQRDPALQARYARALIAADCPVTAERQLRGWLRQRWEPALVAVYGELPLEPERIYNRLTSWLNQRPEDPALLYAAARQAARCERWGPARNHLEAAVARGNDPAMARMLAELYERLGEHDRARKTYRQALGLDPIGNSLPRMDAGAD